MAYTSDLYNSPDGHAAPGATIIGTQSWTDCNDGQGHSYEFKLTPDAYAALSAPDAQMPHKATAESSQPVPSYSTQTDTNSTTTISDETASTTTPTDTSVTDIAVTTTSTDPSINDDTPTTTPEVPTNTEITTTSPTPDAGVPSSESNATTTATTTTQ
jgi:hypothetical protein